MLAELFAVMAPVLFGAGVGYVWVRLGHAYPTEFVSRIVFNIGSPCLILATLAHTRVDLHSFGRMALASALICVCMAALGWAAARLGRQEWQVLVPAYSFPNVGNMGLPVCLYAFGEAGMTLAVAFYLIMSIGNFSLGVFWMSGERSWRSLLGNPILLSVLLALLLMGLDLQLPRWMANTVDLMAGLTIPLMLITLGVSLASIRPRQLGNGFFYGGLRLLLGALVGWSVALALQLPPLAQGCWWCSRRCRWRCSTISTPCAAIVRRIRSPAWCCVRPCCRSPSFRCC
ncbi:AEC family transporter [Pseudomonas aeruginosa]